LSTYVPDPPESKEEGNIFAYRLKKEESFIQAFAWYHVLINEFMKTVSLNILSRSSERGNFIREMVWGQINVLCSLTTASDDVDKAIQGNFIIFLWIEPVSSVMGFPSFFVIDYEGVSSVLFQDGPKHMLSLQATLLYKGPSGVLVFLSLAHHVCSRDVCVQFICTLLYPSLHQEHAHDEGHN